MKRIVKKVFIYTGSVSLLLVIIWCIFAVLVRPSNNRDWSLDNAKLPSVDFMASEVIIHNVRNFSYKSVLDFSPAYYDKTYNLQDINSVDLFIEPFQTPAAHTFLSFGFKNGDHIVVSVEVRRERGEFFSALKGLFRRFEIMYVIADEADVVKLRTNRRQGAVYMYPLNLDDTEISGLFVDILKRADALREKPEFYNTLTNNCTNNIVRHLNHVVDENKRISFSYKYILPAYFGELVYEQGLIDTSKSFGEVQQGYYITDKGLECEDSPDFSSCIRQ